MRIKYLGFAFLVLLLSENIYSQKSIDKGLQQITPELIQKYVNYLASDSMKGRNTPSPELDRAADYIANELASLGVQKVNGSYFQPVLFCTRNLDVSKSYLKLKVGDEEVKSFNLKSEFTPFEMTADTSIASQIVFAGYGITAPEYNYDDYKDLDVKGKIVLIMKHEPGEKDPKAAFDGDKDTKYTLLTSKLKNARDRGAIGVMVVTDPLNHILLTPQGYPWPSLSKYLPQDNLPVELCEKENNIPFVQVGDAVIKCLFGSVDSLKIIQKRIDSSLKPCSFILKSTNCQLATKMTITTYPSKNVVGIIEGRDSKLKNEYVILGGHYDHVGYKKNHKPGEDYIYNGADDNASGTSGVLAIAKAFKTLKKKPKRSIFFIFFTGEELGLYGSKYYSMNPLLPLEKSVVMLNLDMISRAAKDSVEIDGFEYNPDLESIMAPELKKSGLINKPGEEDMFGRSDHFNFFSKGVSAVDISAGMHRDYHTVRDNPDAIDATKAAIITKVTFKTAWFIANKKIYLKTIKPKKNYSLFD